MQLAGWRRLEASRLHRILCKVAGCSSWDIRSYEGFEPGRNGRADTPLALAIVGSVYRARRLGGCCSVLGRLSWELVKALPDGEGERLRKTPVEPAIRESIGSGVGIAALIRAARRFEARPSVETLITLASLAAKEAGRPCSVDLEVERSVERLESRMKAHGVLLALLVPLYIVGMILLGIYSIVPLGIATAVVWHLIRIDGRRFYILNVERGWSRCTMSEKDLEELVMGVPPEAAAYREMLGVRLGGR